MAPLKIPPELKKITQYIRRAEELGAQSSPQNLIVAYHCRQHAVQTGIPLATTPEAKSCLGDILTILEEHRKAMGNFTKEEKYQICRDFAFSIFDKADGEDRAGMANKATAKTFYAAASFLDVLKQFHVNGEENEDVIEEEKKSFYAKWKATDILKAIKEGREVKPGGYGENENDDDDEEKEEDNGNETEQGMEVGMDGKMSESASNLFAPPPYKDVTPMAPPPTNPDRPSSMFSPPSMMPPVKPMPTVSAPVAPAPAPAASSGGFMSSFFGGGGTSSSKYSKETLKDARELTKFALKALDEKDGDLAIERLQQALDCLGNEQ